MSIGPDVRDGNAAGSFFGHVNIVLLTYAGDGALAFAAGVLVARSLGPDGRGAYALFVVSAVLAQMVLGLGLANASVYFLNRAELGLPAVLGATHAVAIGATVVTAAVAAVLAVSAGADALGGGVSVWLLVPAVAALVEGAVLRGVLQARSRFVAMGVAIVVQPLVMLALVIAAYDRSPSPGLLAGYWVISNAASAGAALLAVGPLAGIARIMRPRPGEVARLARFGVQGEAGNVLQLLNYRLDQYLLRAFVGLAGVGVYAVGVSLTEAVWMIANAVALVLLPRLTAASDEEVRWMTPVATRNTLLVAALAAVAVGVAAPLLVPAVFGHDYDRSTRALWWLLPGTVALTGSKVLASYIFSRGRPLVNTGITVVSLAVTLGALLALVPAFGVQGAAAASSLAYGVHFAAALVAYGRISGAPVLEAIVPRPQDASLYADAARGVLARAGIGAGVVPAAATRETAPRTPR